MRNPVVDLVFDDQCPNVAETRVLLGAALLAAGYEPEWREWCRQHTNTPARFLGYASPTILVDGVDIAGTACSEGLSHAPCCRLYSHVTGLYGVPDFATVASALERGGSVQ